MHLRPLNYDTCNPIDKYINITLTKQTWYFPHVCFPCMFVLLCSWSMYTFLCIRYDSLWIAHNRCAYFVMFVYLEDTNYAINCVIFGINFVNLLGYMFTTNNICNFMLPSQHYYTLHISLLSCKTMNLDIVDHWLIRLIIKIEITSTWHAVFFNSEIITLDTAIPGLIIRRY